MGAPNPRGEKCTLTVGSVSITIYAKRSELSPYIGALTQDDVADEVVQTQSVKSHSRKRYPGGPTTSVAGHSRTRTIGGNLPGPTLPGNNAWIEEKIGTGPSAVRKVEQFTYVGSFRTLKAYCRANAVKAFTLRSPWGEPFAISASD